MSSTLNLNDRKVFWSTTAGATTLLGGGTLAAIQNLSEQAFSGNTLTGVIVGCTIVTAGAALTAPTIVHHADVFRAAPFQTKQNISRLAQLACAATGANTAAYAIAPELWHVWTLAGAGVVFGGILGTSMAMEWMINHKPAPETSGEKEERRELEQQQNNEEPETRLFKAALHEVGLDYLKVRSRWDLTDDQGERFGICFRVVVPAKHMSSENGKKGGLTNAHAVSIAAGMTDCNTAGAEFSPDWVEVQRTPDTANVYDIAINRLDMMAELRAYEVDTSEPATIDQPAKVGYGRDGHPWKMRLDQHGRIVGSTESGKSSFLHRAIAYLTRCATHHPNGTPREGGDVIWVVGTHKVYETFGQWIKPYVGTTKRLPFDWIGQGKQDVLDVLVAALQISDERQSLEFDERGAEPALHVIIDEASFALTIQGVAEYLDDPHKATELAATFVKATASANVYLWLATQRGTQDQLGDEGGTIVANLQFSLVFKTKDKDDLHRIFDDWTLAAPKHPGQAWGEVGSDNPTQVKVEYIQEYNPRKKPLHDGPMVTDVAWNRADIPRYLDTVSQRAAGPAYAKRLTNPDEVYDYLRQRKSGTKATKVATEQSAATNTEHTAATSDSDDEFAALADILRSKMSQQDTDADETVDTAAAVDALGGEEAATGDMDTLAADAAANLASDPDPVVKTNDTLENNIFRLLHEADGAMSSYDVFAALKSGGVETKQESVATKLSTLKRGGKLDRSAEGYTLATVPA